MNLNRASALVLVCGCLLCVSTSLCVGTATAQELPVVPDVLAAPQAAATPSESADEPVSRDAADPQTTVVDEPEFELLAQAGAAPPKPVIQGANVNPIAGCLEPPPTIAWEDYKGPFQKFFGILGRKVDRTSVHYRTDRAICSLRAKDKLVLFARNTFEPITLLEAAALAGFDQLENNDPTFGQGAAGYGKRVAADYATLATTRFFTDFVYATAFHEDPRYYRIGQGSFKSRFGHALRHSFVAYRDNGTEMFNYANWLGTLTGVGISYGYHPGFHHGAAPVLESAAYTLATNAGLDVFREFWPNIARALKLPFRQD